MPTRLFDFTGAANHRLAGRIEQPEGRIRGWALFAHCFTCGKDNIAAVRISRSLAGAGIGVLRFDFAGLGASDGAFADTSLGADVGDLIAAANAMTAADMSPSLLIGHSLGGAAVLAAAGDLPSIKAVATIGAPFEPAHVLRQFDPAALAAIEAGGSADVKLAGRPFTIGKGFVDDIRKHDLGSHITALHRALLVMHAPRDTTVGVENATRIFIAARHPKSFVSLDEADHLLSDRRDADYAAGVIAAWTGRYLTEPAAGEPPADAEPAEAHAEAMAQIAERHG